MLSESSAGHDAFSSMSVSFTVIPCFSRMTFATLAFAAEPSHGFTASVMEPLSLPPLPVVVLVPDGFELIVGGHPLPTPASEAGGRRALALAASSADDEMMLALISGGASALMAVPADGVTLEDKRTATEQLLRAGADIHALNTLRKHLSAVKGGWLAARARGSSVALAISDVVGDDVSVIASGPTVADASTFQDALDVVRAFGGDAAFPPAIVARLERGVARAIEETPKPGDPRLARATTTVIGSAAAAALGYHVVLIDDPVVGEARAAALACVRDATARANAVARPSCIVSSGETTVHVVGRGRGGRNQEFALAAAVALARDSGDARDRSATPSAIVVASVGTDGVDGPTDAAGALADATTTTRAQAAGLDADALLADNDAYTFFDAIGDLIRTGPTGTNVGDLQVILLA